MQQLLLTALDGSFVDLVQVLLESYLPLQTVGRLFFITENHPNFFFQAIALVDFFGYHFRFLLNSDEQQFQRILDRYGVLSRPAVHQKLGEVENLLGFDAGAFEDALLVHVHEFLLGDLLVQVLVDLPNHQFDLPAAQLHVHLFQHFLDIVHHEVDPLVLRRKIPEHVHQVLLLGGVELELLQFLFDGLLLLHLLALERFRVELKGFLRPAVLHEQLTVLVLLAQMRWQVLQLVNLLCFLFALFHTNYNTHHCN